MEVDHLLAIQPEKRMWCAARVDRQADHIASLIKTGGGAPNVIRVKRAEVRHTRFRGP